MNDHDIRRLLVHVAAVAPWLTGGAQNVQSQRITDLTRLLREARYPDAVRGLDVLLRDGTDKDALTWSAIVAETLTQVRQRLDDEKNTQFIASQPAGAPRPENFFDLVRASRDRVRSQALARTCPECGAAPGDPCVPRPGRTYGPKKIPIDPDSGRHPETGTHSRRQVVPPPDPTR